MRRNLCVDWRKRTWDASMEIEMKLNEKDIIRSFDILKHWYKNFTGTSLKPSPMELDTMREDYVKLFYIECVGRKTTF